MTSTCIYCARYNLFVFFRILAYFLTSLSLYFVVLTFFLRSLFISHNSIFVSVNNKDNCHLSHNADIFLVILKGKKYSFFPKNLVFATGNSFFCATELQYI